MLTVRKLSLAQASTYYSKENYYTQEQGEFYGKLKDELGLQDLTHESFNQLLQGINPSTGEALVASKQGKAAAVPAFDFTFSPSKSVSIAYEVALAKGDTVLANAMQTAHNNAVNAALNHIEQEHIKTRIQKKGKRSSKNTDNMIAAKFQHDISRDLAPQLHTHSVVFNFTKGEDGKYRALDGSHLLQKGEAALSKSVGQFYRESLKEELKKAGFELRDTNKSKSFFELKNVDDNLIQAFSTRTQTIKAKVEELKKEHPHLSKSQLSLRAFFNTRQTKKEVDRDEVRAKNVELMSKHTNIDKLLSSIKPTLKREVQEKLQIPTEAELIQLIYLAKQEISNKRHRTPLNITNQVISKLDSQIPISDLHSKIKTKEQEQQKEFKTMHDVLMHSLLSTKLDTEKLFSNLKNTPKIQIEEAFENARGTNNRDRFIESYRELTDSNARTKQSNNRDVADIATTTERGESGANIKRIDNALTGAERVNYPNITIDDIRRAEDGHRRLVERENKEKGAER